MNNWMQSSTIKIGHRSILIVEALMKAKVLIRLLTVRQVVDSGLTAINAAGLNPYCMNEGKAAGDEGISTWWIDDAIKLVKGEGNVKERS